MPTGKHPSYFKELTDPHGISMPCDQFGSGVKENAATMGFSCVLFLCLSVFFPSRVCMHCVHAGVCRGQRGTKSFRTELWTPVSPVRGGCFCKGSKCCFTTNMSLPLLGHVKLHIWLVLFFCNRIALEAADPTMQVSSFHIEINTLNTCKCS